MSYKEGRRRDAGWNERRECVYRSWKIAFGGDRELAWLQIFIDKITPVILRCFMRIVSALILLMFTSMALTPNMGMFAAADDDVPILGVLDVCSHANYGMSSDFPCLSVCPCTPEPSTVVGIYESKANPIRPLLVVSQDERPPKFPAS